MSANPKSYLSKWFIPLTRDFIIKITFLTVLILTILIYSFSKEEVLHIALAAGLSQSSYTRTALNGAVLYVDMINQAGGINGKKIVLDQFDDQNDTLIAQQQAQEIVKQNRALAVIGHIYSDASLQAGAIYQQQGIPAITPASSDDALTINNEWYFRATFNNRLLAYFIANYAKKILNDEKVKIIYEDLAYGNSLVQNFATAAKEINLEISFKRKFKVKNNNLDQILNQIVNELKNQIFSSTSADLDLIFLAIHGSKAAKLVKLIKEAGLPNKIIISSSLGFKQYFNNHRKESQKSSYYTDGIYLATPLIFDSAGEKAQNFKDRYLKKYHQEPDWIAAAAYDATQIVIEAIKQAGIKGKTHTLKADRQKIRDYMVNMSRIETAVEGVMGLNYFDKDRNQAGKSISIGIYKNNQVVSAPTQLHVEHYLNDTDDIKAAVKEERLFLIDDQYMFKTNVVYTGIKIHKIDDIDTQNLTFTLDFSLWFRFEGNFNSQNIEFLNAVEPIKLGKPIINETSAKIGYHLYRIKGRFRANFLEHQMVESNHYLLGTHFRHRDLTQQHLIYVKDILGIGLENEVHSKPLKELLNPAYDNWSINKIFIFVDFDKKDSFGNPKYNDFVEYSRFNFGIEVKENKITLRRIFPSTVASYLLILSIIGILLLVFTKQFNKIKPTPYFWLLSILLTFLLLLSSEIVLINKLANKINLYYIKQLIIFFDILWWIVPVFFINKLITYFVWFPLEKQSNRSIPNIIRIFVTIILYLLALFGIIAFVYDQTLTSLLATSGLITMIIGLAIQANIANIFAGIVVNLERPFRVDDWIKIQMGNIFNEGKVVDVTWRTTRLLTREGYIISVPNNMASESIIHNYNYSGKLCESSMTIPIDYAHSPERVEKILRDAVLSTQGILKKPEPIIRFDGLSDWAANYFICFYVTDYKERISCNKAVWKRVWIHLNRVGIAPAIQRQEIYTFRGKKARGEEEATQPITLLNEIEFFQTLSAEQKKYLSERMLHHQIRLGDMIVQQGEPGDSLFIIIEGATGVYLQLEDGQSVEINRFGAGDFFGEMALFTGEPRTATVIAMTNTSLFEINKADIFPFIQEQPDFCRKVSEILAHYQSQNYCQHQNSSDHSLTDKQSLCQWIFNKINRFFGVNHSLD